MKTRYLALDHKPIGSGTLSIREVRIVSGDCTTDGPTLLLATIDIAPSRDKIDRKVAIAEWLAGARHLRLLSILDVMEATPGRTPRGESVRLVPLSRDRRDSIIVRATTGSFFAEQFGVAPIDGVEGAQLLVSAIVQPLDAPLPYDCDARRF